MSSPGRSCSGPCSASPVTAGVLSSPAGWREIGSNNSSVTYDHVSTRLGAGEEEEAGPPQRDKLPETH